MTTVQVARASQLADVYDSILVRSFPTDELVDKAAFMHHSTWGEILVTEDAEGAITGAAVADHHADTRMSVLEYLAVSPDHRGSGSGSALLTAAIERWNELVAPGALLAEVERPDVHHASDEFGDPARRLAFYDRHGFKALALPYYQPALSDEQKPVPDLILAVLVLDPSWVNEDGTRFLEGARLEEVLVHRSPEPAPGEEDAYAALLAATRDPAGIELLPLSEYSQVPRSGPLG